MARQSYRDVAVCVPFTVPYERYSIRSAHWFFGQVLAGLLARASIPKDAIDGLCVSSFTLMPDSAVGLTQHLGVVLDAVDLDPRIRGEALALADFVSLFEAFLLHKSSTKAD